MQNEASLAGELREYCVALRACRALTESLPYNVPERLEKMLSRFEPVLQSEGWCGCAQPDCDKPGCRFSSEFELGLKHKRIGS